MRRFLFVLLVVVAGVVGLAFYLGWVGFTSDDTGGLLNITFRVNKDKFQEDEKAVLEKVRQVGPAATDKAAPPSPNDVP